MNSGTDDIEKSFAAELKELRKDMLAGIGKKDFLHLKKIENWGWYCFIAGYATAWIFPNPFSVLLITLASMVRWCIMMHHIGHKGYNTLLVPKRYTSNGFAKGWRRFVDWFDWMYPAAWNYEHNILHHYHTGENKDPDLVERNLTLIRNAKIPVAGKYLAIAFFMCTWKFTYYAPNTFWLYTQARNNPKQKNVQPPVTENFPGVRLFIPINKTAIEFWFTCLLPYALLRFVVIPMLFIPFGFKACLFVFINSVLAELLTNIYTFIIIVPNHAGEDLYRFKNGIQTAAAFYIRQVVGSVNYTCGNDRIDFLHGWLNYQIEHHLFPDMPLLKYQQYQPAVKALCSKYNIPYQQQTVWKRFKKMTDIAIGKTSMKVY